MRPIVLPPNIIDHFYLGGERIAELRGVDMTSPRRPEEWLAATTHRAGEPDIGPSRTESGESLTDLILADPTGWLGTDAGPAGDNGILVKLLDPAQRLPVHVHPDRNFANSHLDCPYGKTEAWFVLATSGEHPSVWLGWSEPVDEAELRSRVEAQDSEWMLSRMNRIGVRPGDGILVPAGTAHAIGDGVFVAEVQEPTDFSILLEWSVTTATREESHLDLGMSLALSAMSYAAFTPDDLAALVTHTDLASTSPAAQPLLARGAEPFFRLDLLAPEALAPEGSAEAAVLVPGESAAGQPTARGRDRPGVPAGFAVAIVLDGAGEMRSAGGDVMPVGRGQVFAVPADFGDWKVSGKVRVLSCRPGAGWPQTLFRSTNSLPDRKSERSAPVEPPA